MPSINYAAQYARELAQAYPYALNFGALYATPNNGRYRMGEDGKISLSIKKAQSAPSRAA